MKLYKVPVKKKPFRVIKNKGWDLTVTNGKVKWE